MGFPPRNWSPDDKFTYKNGEETWFSFARLFARARSIGSIWSKSVNLVNLVKIGQILVNFSQFLLKIGQILVKFWSIFVKNRSNFGQFPG